MVKYVDFTTLPVREMYSAYLRVRVRVRVRVRIIV